MTEHSRPGCGKARDIDSDDSAEVDVTSCRQTPAELRKVDITDFDYVLLRGATTGFVAHRFVRRRAFEYLVGTTAGDLSNLFEELHIAAVPARIPRLRTEKCYNLVTLRGSLMLKVRSQTPVAEEISPPPEQIRRGIERVAFECNRTAKAPRVEAVHDLRVAIRRSEQALVMFKTGLPRKPLKRIRRRLKSILSAAGSVRDCDIALRILLEAKQPDAAALRRHVQVRRREAERSLHIILKRLSLPIAKWCHELKLSSSSIDADREALQATARSILPKLAERFFKAGEASAADGSGTRLHDFRIRAKKFRYALELFLPVYGSVAAEWIRDVKAVQSSLGAMNDYRMVLSIAADLGCSHELQAALKDTERRNLRQFRKIWAERFTERPVAAWIRALRGGGKVGRTVRKPITLSTTAAQRAIAAVA
jgi:CHAD domain-containing protein